ncbi:MAG: hypothetical protein IH958_04355 [Chloroflexi bacterium]|nr:hypothetical protein [Chloroflexota bacterium]
MVGVGGGVAAAVAVGMPVGVAAGVLVGVGMPVGVGMGVLVGVGMPVGVGVGVLVGVGMPVGVGVGAAGPVKKAVTLRSPFIITVLGLEPLFSAPDHIMKEEPEAGFATNVTWVPGQY